MLMLTFIYNNLLGLFEETTRMSENNYCDMCVHFYICVFEKCGKCGAHLHDGGREE